MPEGGVEMRGRNSISVSAYHIADPLGAPPSWKRSDRIEAEARAYLGRIDRTGGMLRAVFGAQQETVVLW